MPLGVTIDAMSVAFGGIIGSLFSKYISEELKANMTLIFGLCACGMAVNSIILVKQLPAVILSLICGSIIGISLHLEGSLKKMVRSLLGGDRSEGLDNERLDGLITVIVLFCASANGIYGSLESGFSGDHTILISKSIMDFFTAMVFACTYKKVISLISVPQFMIYVLVYFLARFIYPFLDPTMLADFKGCGGLLMLATGLKVMKTTKFPLVDMIPSLIVVIPLSALFAFIY